MKHTAEAGTLIVVLGDQLGPTLPTLAQADRATSRVLLCEVAEETTYVPHHTKKIAFVFAAMRHFAEELRAAGWQVDYVRLDDRQNSGTFSGEVKRALDDIEARVRTIEASEWRVLPDAALLAGGLQRAGRHPRRHAVHLQPRRVRWVGARPPTVPHGKLPSRDAPQKRSLDGRR